MTNNESKLISVKTPNLFLALSSLGMVISSAYLYWHYFAIQYPSTLVNSSFCEINSFISCNAVSYSPISAIFGIPISIFGLLNGLFILYSTINYSKLQEELNHLLAFLNFIGCIILLLISLFYFKHLCPVCFLYYIFSTMSYVLYFKYGAKLKFNIKPAIYYIVITIVVLAASFMHHQYEKSEMFAHSNIFINDFYTYPNLGAPRIESPYRIYSSTPKFTEAPIQLSIFSDFQCPACSYLAQIINQIIGRYEKHLNIQFFFYPLDSSCNDQSGLVHPLSCKSSYLASCLPKQFHSVHDEIFNKIETISSDWLDRYAKNKNVYDCMNDIKTKEVVVKLINIGKDFNIQATPTLILNGVKIEGVLPIPQLIIIMDEILRRHNEKR